MFSLWYQDSCVTLKFIPHKALQLFLIQKWKMLKMKRGAFKLLYLCHLLTQETLDHNDSNREELLLLKQQ